MNYFSSVAPRNPSPGPGVRDGKCLFCMVRLTKAGNRPNCQIKSVTRNTTKNTINTISQRLAGLSSFSISSSRFYSFCAVSNATFSFRTLTL